MADWGRPTNLLMGILFYAIRILDGFANTGENVKGRLTRIFEEYGFAKVTLRDNLSTIYGTMVLYSAVKPDES